MREQKLAIMALGKDRSVTLDGMEQTSIFNALQTRVTFTGQCAPQCLHNACIPQLPTG